MIHTSLGQISSSFLLSIFDGQLMWLSIGISNIKQPKMICALSPLSKEENIILIT